MAEEFHIQLMTELYKADVNNVKKVAEKLKITGTESKSKFYIINRIAEELQKQLLTVEDEEKSHFLHDFIELIVDIPPPLEPPKVKTEAGKEEQIKQEYMEKDSWEKLVDTTSVLRRQFKILGQIGEADQKDKLTYNSLVRQIKSGKGQGYKDVEIVDAVVRAIVPGLVLRSYLESFEDLPLDRLKKILSSHYGVKSTSELYQSLVSLCQSPKETPQAFLMRALDIRQKILFASDESEDGLKYETEHIQQLFLRTVETGLLDENVRVRIRPFLSDHDIQDEDLIHQFNVAVTAEGERNRKFKSQPKSKPAQVSTLGTEKGGQGSNKPRGGQDSPSSSDMTKVIEGLKAELAALRTEVKSRPQAIPFQSKETPAPPSNPNRERGVDTSTRIPKCLACKESNQAWCTHCFKCGSDSHYARGCRQSQGTQRPLNNQRLLPRGRK